MLLAAASPFIGTSTGLLDDGTVIVAGNGHL